MACKKKQIEIEFRSLLKKEKYYALKNFLNENADDLGEDDKDVYFFLLPNKIVKVTKNVSKKTAKIVIKLNRLGRGSCNFEEIEIPINLSDFNNTVKLFKELPFDQIQNSYQKRHNYFYNGVELALKYTKSWGYHLELEIMVDKKSKSKKSEEKIRAVAKKLGVRIMEEEELAKFAKDIDEQYKKSSHKGKK